MGDGGAADDGSSPPAAAGFSYLAVFHNYPLVAALLGFAIAQSIKFFVTWYVPSPPCLDLGTPAGSGASVSSDPRAVPLVKAAASWHCSHFPFPGEPSVTVPILQKNFLCLELEEW